MRIIMKPEATENQINIGKQMYPNVDIRRENELYVALRCSPIGEKFCGVFTSLDMVELQIGKIRQLKPFEKTNMECCGITENGIYIFKTTINVKQGGK